MKKKETKSVLKIKENWSKNLTLSDEVMQSARGGFESADSYCPLCDECTPGAKETEGTKEL